MKHQDAMLRRRWVYVAQNLQVEANVSKVVELLKRAKTAGYNGMVLADYKLNILDRVPDYYFKNAATVKQAAAELGIALYPTVCSGGYDNGLLAHDPNLAEGLPVKDAVFTVKGKTATLESGNLLPGGALDEVRNGNFVGWDFNDAAALDTTVKKSGAGALRFTATEGNLRVSKRLALPPFRQYHLSVWIKTEGFKSAGEIHCTVLPGGAKANLCHSNAGVKPTQDWTQHHFVFNTLDNPSIGIYLGCWDASGGTLWLDEIRLEEVGLLNVLRRSGCPLTVRGDEGKGTLYTEGQDYAKITDPRMGTVPWPGEFEVWHAPPSIAIPTGSRIKDGQKLRVSYYHAITIYDGQVSASLVDPKVFELHQDQLQRVQKLLTPAGFFLSHDELRTAGWSADAQATGKTPGVQLAEHVRKCIALAKQTSPRAELVAWSDMFDPHHNAVNNYYLVRGSLAGSWEGLSKDTLIMNWNSGKQRESLNFFAKRGHGQILAGYYDGDPSAIKGWLATAKALGGANVSGVMYTTWANNYSQLEAFAKAAF